MLTTTVDGLWALQVLANIEVLAPELGLRPHLPSIETVSMALAHPVVAELRESGAITADGDVDVAVLEWFTVLARRDVAVVVHAQTPAAVVGAERCVNSERILIARFAHWWVVLERYGPMIRLSSAGVAKTEDAAAAIICSHIEKLCGPMSPAAVRPVTLCTADLLAIARNGSNLQAFLAKQGLDHSQTRMLSLAADNERSAYTSVVAIQSGVGTGLTRTHIDYQAVTIIDTPEGRMIADQRNRNAQAWLMISPGSTSEIRSSIKEMMCRLPAGHDWSAYRKVV